MSAQKRKKNQIIVLILINMFKKLA